MNTRLVSGAKGAPMCDRFCLPSILDLCLLPLLLGRGGDDHAEDERERAHLEDVVQQIGRSLGKVSESYDRARLDRALAEIGQLSGRLVGDVEQWTRFVEALVQEAECEFGTSPGQGRAKAALVKTGILATVRAQKFEFDFAASFLAPLVIDRIAGLFVTFVVALLNKNDLWVADTSGTRPAASAMTGANGLVARVMRWLALRMQNLAWWIVTRGRRLPAPLRLLIDTQAPQVRPVLADAAELARWTQENSVLVEAVAQITSIATQEAEAFIEMSGEEKKRYARNAIIEFLLRHFLPIGTHGFGVALTENLVDMLIDAAVSIFNRRGLFDHGGVVAAAPAVRAAA